MSGKSKKVEKNISDADIKNQQHLFAHEKDKPQELDTTKVVKFPKNVIIQRQKRILMKRLKVPPAVNHFTHTLDKANTVQLFRFLEKYRPDDKKDKKDKQKAVAKKGDKTLKVGKTTQAKAPVVKGIKNVTSAIESKQAKLVVIAHDVDPIEYVIYLPYLCRKLDVPYCIVKSKSRLGKLVSMKTCACISINDCMPEDTSNLNKIIEQIKAGFVEKYKEEMHHWGGSQLSEKTIKKLKAEGKLK